MAVEAVVGQIDLATDKPARPGNAVAGIEQRVKRPIELDAEVLDDGVPEPLDIGRRPGDQLAIAGDPVPLHEAADVGIIDDLLNRLPHETVRGSLPECSLTLPKLARLFFPGYGHG